MAMDFLQLAAISECLATNICHAFGDNDRGKVFAKTTHKVSNARYAVRDVDRGKPTTFERAASDVCNAVGDVDGSETAVLKGR